jgi:chromosome segregation and condensation protein ScpB
MPSVRTHGRLRATLGLEARSASLIPRRLPVGLDEDRVAARCAALLVTGDVPLADLASALDISIVAVRENLDRAAERLAAMDLSLTTTVAKYDCGRSPVPRPRCGPSPTSRTPALPRPRSWRSSPSSPTSARPPARTSSATSVRTRESLLDRLVRSALLAKVRDDQDLGAPNVYRVTAKALRAAGFATAEATRAAVAKLVSAEESMRLGAIADDDLEQTRAWRGGGRLMIGCHR